MLQADSEKLRQAWVQAVQASIASAYRESPDSCYSEVWPRTARTPACTRVLRWDSSCRLRSACACGACMSTRVRATCTREHHVSMQCLLVQAHVYVCVAFAGVHTYVCVQYLGVCNTCACARVVCVCEHHMCAVFGSVYVS